MNLWWDVIEWLTPTPRQEDVFMEEDAIWWEYSYDGEDDYIDAN